MVESVREVFSIRPMEASDLAAVSEWLADLDDLSRFDRSMRVPQGLDSFRKSWPGLAAAGGRDEAHWFSITTDSDAPVGIVGLESVNLLNGDAVVPMFIDRTFRRRGIATRALALAMDIAFDQLRLQRLTSYLRADNDVSRALIERVGFRQEGCMRQAWFSGGRHLDMVIVGILRQEWNDHRNALAAGLDPRTIVRYGRNGSDTWSWPPTAEDREGRTAAPERLPERRRARQGRR